MAKFSIIERLRDIKSITKELALRLRALTFEDNFDSFIESSLSIPAGTSIRVRNKLQLKANSVILLHSQGTANIGASDNTGEAWTKQDIYIKNYDSNDATLVKVLIMRD